MFVPRICGPSLALESDDKKVRRSCRIGEDYASTFVTFTRNLYCLDVADNAASGWTYLPVWVPLQKMDVGGGNYITCVANNANMFLL